MKHLSVKFNPWDRRTYTYEYDPSEATYEPGDEIIVPSPQGDKVVTVESLVDQAPSFACKAVIGMALRPKMMRSAMLDETTAGIGHNGGPAFDPEEVARLDAAGQEFLEAAAQWLENGDLETEEDAKLLNDFMAGVKARAKIAEDARVKAKKPHDDAGKAVQAAFKPVIEKMEKANSKVQPLLTEWLKKEQAKKDAETERLRAEAHAAQEEANRKAEAAAARNDISGEVDAEAAQKEAAKKAKDAERFAKKSANVGSATGGGRTASLRTVIEVEVTNARVLFMRYQDRPEVMECLRSLAAREARQASFNVKTDKIPGTEITEIKKAV